MAKPVPSRGSDQFMVRFPEGMRRRIKEIADDHGRSMNSEIIRMLEKAIDDYDWERHQQLEYKQLIEENPETFKLDEKGVILDNFIVQLEDITSKTISSFIDTLYPDRIKAEELQEDDIKNNSSKNGNEAS